MRVAWVVLLGAAGCNSILGVRDIGLAGASADAPPGSIDGSPDAPPGSQPDARPAVGYTVYAHSDSVLYSIDLQHVKLVTVGPFNAPTVGSSQDVITDLAVAPNGAIYAISETQLYTADPADGHVTLIGATAACGTKTVALTMTPSGTLYAGDAKGAICAIDLSGATPVVGTPVTMSNNLALAGDFVAIDDGTVFGTAYLTTDPPTGGSNLNNVLVTIDVKTGATTQIGASGFGRLFGTGYAGGTVFGFTHDGTGRVVTIDRNSGVGTLYATFTDPTTTMPISFAGAGVSPLVTRD